jgi:hypothetical protein
MLSDKFRTTFSSAKNQDGAQKGTILIIFILKRAIKPKLSSKLMVYKRLFVECSSKHMVYKCLFVECSSKLMRYERILVRLGNLLVKIEQILVSLVDLLVRLADILVNGALSNIFGH